MIHILQALVSLRSGFRRWSTTLIWACGILWTLQTGFAIAGGAPVGGFVDLVFHGPVPPEAQSGVVDVVASSFQSYSFLKDDGLLYFLTLTGFQYPAETNFAAISAQGGITLALKTDGSVLEWGGRAFGFDTIPAEASTNVIAVATDGAFRAALRSSGEVVVWGGGRLESRPVPNALRSKIKAIATGNAILVLTEEGRVLVWNPLSAPETADLSVPPEAAENVVSISAGSGFGGVVKADGTAIVWKFGSTTLGAHPDFGSRRVRSIHFGSNLQAALFEDGTMLAWYDDGSAVAPEFAQSFEPYQGLISKICFSLNETGLLVQSVAPIISRRPGDIFLFEGGTLELSVTARGYMLQYQWNHNGAPIPGATNSNYRVGGVELSDAGSYSVTVSNRFGAITTDPPSHLEVGRIDPARPSGTLAILGISPAAIAAIPDSAQQGVKSVAMTSSAGFDVKADGTARGWGALPYVDPSTATNLLSVTGGLVSILALHADGTLVGWDSSPYGEGFIPPQAARNVVATASGYYHSMALRRDASVVCWGAPDDGRCLVPDGAKSGVIAIAAGGGHSLAVTAAGAVIGWGLNDSGQITIPEAAKSGVVAVAAGLRHSMALRSDGSVVCWGLNNSGQCTVPEAAHTQIKLIAAGRGHSVAIRQDGTFVGWGDNSNHQLDVPVGLDGGAVALVAFENQTALIVDEKPLALLSVPTSQAVAPGTPLHLRVGVAGFPQQIQWQKDGVNIEGGTGRLLNLGAARPEDSGLYTVVVSNRLGALTTIPSAVIQVDPSIPRPRGIPIAWGANGVTNLFFRATEGAVAVVQGGEHGLAIRSDGTLLSWGKNQYGQTDIPAAARSGVTAIAAGYYHSVALRSDGSVIAWGAGQSNLNTIPHVGQSLVPVEAASDVVAISARGYRTVALKRDGTVLSWGTDEAGNPGRRSFVNRNLIALATGLGSTAGLKRDGSVEIWRETTAGTALSVPEMVQGQTTDLIAGDLDFGTPGITGQPFVVSGNLSNAPRVVWPSAELQHTIESIGIGTDHVIYLRNDGTLAAAGSNLRGQLNIPAAAQQHVLAISAAGDDSVALVSFSAPSRVALSSDQSVIAGDPILLRVTSEGFPLRYQWSHDGTPIAAATNDTLSIPVATVADSGSYQVQVFNAVGTNSAPRPALVTVNPALGHVLIRGTGTLATTPVPTAIANGVVAVSAGYNFAVALRADGSVVAWGEGVSDQTQVPSEAATGVRRIACGPGFALALKQDGSVHAWGFNSAGVLTIPPTAMSDVTSIAAGNHALALKTDGSVVAWGYGDQGQTRVPAAIQGHVRAIAAGLFFSMALLDDGSVSVWGDNSLGQRNVPPEANHGIVAIAAGAFHALALTDSGRVIAWGDGSQGQVLVPDAATSDVASIVAGGVTSLALRRDGTLVQWGTDPSGPIHFPDPLPGIASLGAGMNTAFAILGQPVFLDSIRVAGGIRLQWSTNLTGFRLESAASIQPSTDWQPLSQSPESVGGLWSVPLPFDSEGRFFRLTSP